jgi:hypothetical protein
MLRDRQTLRKYVANLLSRGYVGQLDLPVVTQVLQIVVPQSNVPAAPLI